ncbi:ABC-type dipeptide transport system, periplasmic component [Microbacterium sp. HM58-2]|nr:ABC-type dipeptide transport system, periplasmic component [Microbacterium sp. HM58-2]
MFPNRRSVALAAAAVVAVLTLGGCAAAEPEPAETGSETQERADRLTLINAFSVQSLDVAAGVASSTMMLFEPTFDTLVKLGPSGDFEPVLATKWEFNDDNTVLTLTLREDVKFTDGTDVDAAAVVASLERLRDGTSTFGRVMAGKEFAAVDDMTVSVTSATPDPAVLSRLGSAGFIQAPSTFDSPDVGTKPVGSGPYILDTETTVIGTTYNYTANPDYWDPDAIKYDNLTINLIGDSTAVLNAMKAGEANSGLLRDNEMLLGVEAAGWSTEEVNANWLGLVLTDREGTLAPALADARVRQAINYALDREALSAALFSGVAKPQVQPFLERYDAYDADLEDAYPYDPKKAKKLLAEAGYADGFTLEVPFAVQFKPALELIGQQFADVGITLKTTDPGPAGYVPAVASGKFPANWNALGQPSDWEFIAQYVAPNAPGNPQHAQDDELDKLIEDVQFSTGDDAIKARKKLNEYLVDEAWFAPVSAIPNIIGLDPGTELAYWNFTSSQYPPLLAYQPAK